MASTSTPQVPFFKKSRARPSTNRRQRSASPSGPQETRSEVVIPTKKAVTNLLSAGTKRKISEVEDSIEGPERDGPDVKWTAEGSHITAALDILAGDELEELMERKRISERRGEEDEEIPDDGQYRGQNAYKSHLLKSKEVPKAMRVGPQRNTTSTIRTVTIVDYQPDVCKDYKETGYCGFGDTCKFLHDRGTYLAGWQLDKLAENAAKQGQDADETDSDSDDEDVPFACLICRKHYTDPVVTRCGHFFCSACAIKRFAKTPKCLACGAPTGGMFNRADKILDKINQKRKDRGEIDGDGDEDGGEHTGQGVVLEGLEEEQASSEDDD